jgi:hypothetical protein
MKKAQMPSQIFIYILAVVLVTFILVYGYKAVVVFKGKSEQISYINFRTTLESGVKKISTDYDSVLVYNDKNPLKIDPKYKQVCFVKNYDSTNPKNYIPMEVDTNILRYQGIVDSTRDGAKENVFLLSRSVEESFYVGKIDVEPNIVEGQSIVEHLLCVNMTKGKVKIKLTGMGDHALISELKS